MEISHILKEYRKTHGISQFELSSFLHATQAQISNWENGLQIPSRLRQIEITRKLGYEDIPQ